MRLLSAGTGVLPSINGANLPSNVAIPNAIGVTSSGYRSAIELLEARRHPLDRMHTHDFPLREAELAIRTLAREIPDEESIHSCLFPGKD